MTSSGPWQYTIRVEHSDQPVYAESGYAEHEGAALSGLRDATDRAGRAVGAYLAGYPVPPNNSSSGYLMLAVRLLVVRRA